MIFLPEKIHQLYNEELITGVEKEYARYLLSLYPGVSETVLMAAIIALHVQLNGHICLDIHDFINHPLFKGYKDQGEHTSVQVEHLLEELKNSELTGDPGELKPLILEEERLYLHKFWKYEDELAEWVKAKSRVTHTVTQKEKEVICAFCGKKTLFDPVNWQSVAITLSFLKDLLIISGGPGTGKTYTVLNIIRAQKQAREGESFKIALAAPTGKASRRLSESIHAGRESLKEPVDLPEEALTVHKLLGADYHSSRFKYHQDNKLPYDLIVVDEASMLDITMWIRLKRAVPEHAKLILLGDKDQLASVEAGSILGDLCEGGKGFTTKTARHLSDLTGGEITGSDSASYIDDSMVFLTKSYRFDEKSGIKKLSEAINASDAGTVMELLKSDEYPDIRWLPGTSESMEYILDEFAVKHYQEYHTSAPDESLSSANKRKILCALRGGPFGVEQINRVAERKIKLISNLHERKEWYSGRLVMCTRNNPVLKIRNGEIGICESKNGKNLIHFEGESTFPVAAGRLSNYEPAYAITIHKSQGSEFENVAIVLPDQVNPLLSKELLYTSVTRARQSVLVIGDPAVIRETVERNVTRKSGLSRKIRRDLK